MPKRRPVADAGAVCNNRRRGGSRCHALLVLVDGIVDCPSCQRTRRGICLHCDGPVDGKRGFALWCAHHHLIMNRLRWRRRYIQKPNPMPRSERSRRAGLKGGVTRRERLSPERRAEIARMGGEARAAMYRQRREEAS